MNMVSAEIQRVWRGYHAKLQYEFDLMDIIKTQSLVHGFIVRRAAARQHYSSCKIQSIVRMWLARRLLASKIEIHAALHIQSAYQDFIVRVMVERRNMASVEIQKVWRGYHAEIQYRLNLVYIITTQRLARGFIARKVASRRYHSTCKIESSIRMWLARRRTASNFKIHAVLQVQRTYRGFAIRAKVERMNRASTKIQRVWRVYHAEVQYRFDLIDIITAQNVARRFITQRRVGRCHNLTIKIQSIVRMWLAKSFLVKTRELNAKNYNASRIQKVWRATICQYKYHRMRQVAYVCQKYCRGNRVRSLLLLQKHSAITVQRCWKVFLEKKGQSNKKKKKFDPSSMYAKCSRFLQSSKSAKSKCNGHTEGLERILRSTTISI